MKLIPISPVKNALYAEAFCTILGAFPMVCNNEAHTFYLFLETISLPEGGGAQYLVC